MKKLGGDAHGFITMIVLLLLVILTAVVLAYLRVRNAQ